MYVRVTPVRFDPAREEEIVRLTRERLVPAARLTPGFQHYFGTADRAHPGRGYVITVWDTAEQADRAREVLGGAIGPILALGVDLGASEVHEIVVES
jgi:hypothetical protein